MAVAKKDGGSIQGWHLGRALLPSGWARDVRITAVDGLIASIEVGCAAVAGDERGALALPLVPNLHSHAFQRVMAGLTERRSARADNFWSWRTVMYRFVARLTPDDVEAITTMAFMEMVESGFGHVAEFHYLHHAADGARYADPAEMAGRVIHAAAQTGIGLTLLPVFYAQGGFGGLPAGAAQARFLHDVDGYAALVERARGLLSGPAMRLGIAPHSLRAVTPDQLRAILCLARAGDPVHIHIAEQVREVEDCLAWAGARPVEWLLDNVEVDGRWCLVHATHLTEGECRRAARSGAVAGLCPVTEANLGDGIFPLVDWIEGGGRWGLGSDSNVHISWREEACLLEYSQRLAQRARNVVTVSGRESSGRALLEGALTGGAVAVGMPGGLAPGRPASMAILADAHPALLAGPGESVLDSLIFAGKEHPMGDIWLHGRKVVSQGRHRDRDAIESRYRSVMSRLLES